MPADNTGFMAAITDIQMQIVKLTKGLQARMDKMARKEHSDRMSRSTTPRAGRNGDDTRGGGRDIAGEGPGLLKGRGHTLAAQLPGHLMSRNVKHRCIAQRRSLRHTRRNQLEHVITREAMMPVCLVTMQLHFPMMTVMTNPTRPVNELLVAAGSALGKKRGTNILAPHRYVICGSKNNHIGMEEAMWPEYVAALCRMMKDTKLLVSWSKLILDHLHQLATTASHWDWHTCRQWSEAIFTMIAEGRLPMAGMTHTPLRMFNATCVPLAHGLIKQKPAAEIKRTTTPAQHHM